MQRHAMEIAVGQVVELTAVENSELDLTGQRGTVIKMNPESGLASVRIEGSGSEVSVWPETLKIVSNARAVADGAEPAAAGPT